MRKKGTREPHPMLRVWLRKIGDAIKKKRGDEKQEAFAFRVRVSRQLVGAIENGKRSYQIEPLLDVLAGLGPDPVRLLLSITKDMNKLSGEDVKACQRLIDALSDGRREMALKLLDGLDMASPVQRETRAENQ